MSELWDRLQSERMIVAQQQTGMLRGSPVLSENADARRTAAPRSAGCPSSRFPKTSHPE
jgi:hypothetical protein